MTRLSSPPHRCALRGLRSACADSMEVGGLGGLLVSALRVKCSSQPRPLCAAARLPPKRVRSAPSPDVVSDCRPEATAGPTEALGDCRGDSPTCRDFCVVFCWAGGGGLGGRAAGRAERRGDAAATRSQLSESWCVWGGGSLSLWQRESLSLSWAPPPEHCRNQRDDMQADQTAVASSLWCRRACRACREALPPPSVLGCP